MYAEDVFVWAVSIAAGLGLVTAIVTAILMWRHGGHSAGDMAKYTASAFLTPACIVLAIGGWLHGKLPPGHFSIAGIVDQSVTSAAAFEAGEHCLAGPAADRHHPGIRVKFERYAPKIQLAQQAEDRVGSHGRSDQGRKHGRPSHLFHSV